MNLFFFSGVTFKLSWNHASWFVWCLRDKFCNQTRKRWNVADCTTIVWCTVWCTSHVQIRRTRRSRRRKTTRRCTSIPQTCLRVPVWAPDNKTGISAKSFSESSSSFSVWLGTLAATTLNFTTPPRRSCCPHWRRSLFFRCWVTFFQTTRGLETSSNWEDE